MADDVSQILTSIIERQSHVEKVQAAHEQVLTNLVQGSSELVDKVDKLEEGVHARFDKIEERSRFPVGHMLAFLSVVVAIAGFSIGGLAYYMKLSSEPGLMRLTYMEKKLEDINNRMYEDDNREKQDYAHLATLDTTISQHKATLKIYQNYFTEFSKRLQTIERDYSMQKVKKDS
jgi:septal ring factor EnvC (AmiA/AmiB activator)